MNLLAGCYRGRPVLFAITLLCWSWTIGRPGDAQAQTEQPFAEQAPKLIPVAIFNVASVERSLGDISNMFQVAGRPDMMDVIQGFLEGYANDLKGFDRTRPLGYMLFLEPSLPPRPRMVIYFPVSNEVEFVETLRQRMPSIAEVGEHTYEFENSGRRGKTPVLIQGDYAFILPTGQGFLKGEEFPDPQTICGPLAARYDVSMSFRLRGIPALIREVFSSFITQQFAAQMQQRDNEREEAYVARRVQGTSAMEGIQQLIRDGEEVIIGLDSTADGRRAMLETTIQARPDSDYAKSLMNVAGKQSYFTPLLQAAHPLQVSVSWNLDARQQTAALGYLQALRILLKRELSETSTVTVDLLVDGLEATVRQNHIDGVLQFLKRPGNELVLVGGVKVVGGDAVGKSIKDVLLLVKDRAPKFDIQLDAHQFQGVSLSKLPGQHEDAKMTQIYGRTPDLYVGTGANVLWFAFGGNDTLAALDQAIETTVSAPAGPQTPTATPFQAILHASAWLKYLDADDLESPQGALVLETLAPENDSLRLEVVPMESGVRCSLRFDEGFVHLVGGLLAQFYDQTQI